MTELTGNKGEWSEIYVFLRLLDIGKLFAADENLNKIDSTYYDIFRILRDENIGHLDFCYDKNTHLVTVKNGEKTLFSKKSDEFKKEADLLYDGIVNAKGSSFSVDKTNKFLSDINIDYLKAKSVDKTDILIEVHDINTGINAVQGFSIKSRLGHPSTLINAGNTTNFIYEVHGVNDEIVSKFNSFKLFKDKFSLLKNNNCSVEYFGMKNEIFENNLILIDSNLPLICGYLLLEYYSGSKNTVVDCLNVISAKNPLKYNISNGHQFYNYKFKKMLTDCALGMRPSNIWDGTADATGGYIIVREDGEVLCYHLFNRNYFENYLLKNTKFETPSTTRYGFGYIYKDNERYFLKLNLQVRFIK